MKALRPWIDVFGQDRIMIRNYEPIKSRRLGILSELEDLFEIKIDAKIFNLDVPANPSIPNALVELKRLCNRWNTTPQEFQRTNRALQFLQNNWELPGNDEVELLDAKNRFTIARAFQRSHEELSVFRGDGALFFPTLEDAIFDRKALMTDAEAAIRYAGIFQFLLSHMA
jgi:hypothetical protein